MKSESGTTRPLVAIVDDEIDIVTYLTVVLEDHGYGVVATSDARKAGELLERAQPDIILLDLLMPRVTGVSLYSQIATHPKLGGTPIVILSGLDVRKELPDLLKGDQPFEPPRAFIDKPIDVEEVLLVIEEIVGRAQSVEACT